MVSSLGIKSLGIKRVPCKSCGSFFTLAYPPLIGKTRCCLKCGAVSAGDKTVTLGANSITLGDAAGAPGAVGILQRNAANLLYHDGTNDISLTGQMGIITLFIDGILTVGTLKKNYNFDAPLAGVILSARAKVNTAPTGAALLIDINEDGTTIFTATKLTVAIGATAGEQTTVQNTAFAKGAIFTFDIDQIGSTIAGADLLIELMVLFTRTD